MSVIEALNAARAAGVGLALDGDDLVLEASAQPPAAVLEALLRCKVDIIALLRLANDGSAGEDCQAFQDERVGLTPRRTTAAKKTEGILWAEWKAVALNRIFQQQGITGQPGRITAATVLLGERKANVEKNHNTQTCKICSHENKKRDR